MKKFLELFFWFLESLGIRCSKCGSFESSKFIDKELDWGSNGSGNMAMEPFYVKYERRCCDTCGHMFTSTFAGTEELGNV